ncbi:hypothetical protein ABZ135_34700 [Streptomyces sp. NPDC006339]|uniref:hypothetical protein n=1 Tax=Streptomyces sp. NPDC006339 TaxID=3156755 RepID=UPI0033B5191D
MSDDFDVDDVAAMRREGDFRSFLRGQMRKPSQPEPQKPRARPTGRPPGAWPTETRRPEQPAVQHPPEAWEKALQDYRDWLVTTDHPEFMDQGQICGCAGCRPFNRKDRS